MAQFMNATQARGEIERILTNAKYTIVMISPFIKINDDLIKRLTDAGDRNVKIIMVCKEEDLKSSERSKIDQIPNLVLRSNDRVHAKCFYNEDSMVITSLNLYESSLGDNHEMGILLHNDHEEDKLAFQEAKNEAQYILRDSPTISSFSNTKFVPETKTKVNYKSNEPKPVFNRTPIQEQSTADSIIKGISNFFGFENDTGHCLHCGKDIPLNVNAPYCPECYKRWAKYNDDTYKEKICHKCGNTADTSKKHPLCYACYKKSQ
jgi:hypothetical protein